MSCACARPGWPSEQPAGDIAWRRVPMWKSSIWLEHRKKRERCAKGGVPFPYGETDRLSNLLGLGPPSAGENCSPFSHVTLLSPGQPLTKCPWQCRVPEEGAGWAERDLKVPFDVALP